MSFSTPNLAAYSITHVAMQAALAAHFSALEELGEHAGPARQGATPQAVP